MVCLIVTLAILVITYTLLVTELVDPTLAVLVGGIIMSIVVKVFASFGAIPGVDLNLIENETIAQLKNVLMLLFGMMIIVSVLSKTGFFQWSAIKAYDLAGCRVKPLIVLLMVFTAVLSAFMDNVTTILLMAPVTLELAKLLKIKPVPLLIGEATASNIGGAATLIGDPPHIILGGAAHLTFMDFIIHLTPIVVVIFIIFVFIILKVMKDPDRKEGEQCVEVEAIREMYIIKDEILFKRIALVFGLVIFMFVIHPYIHLDVGEAAIIGAIIALLVSGENIHEAMKSVEWPTLIFFAALFALMGGARALGFIDAVVEFMEYMTGGDVMLTIILMLWFSALLSAIIGAVPTTMVFVHVAVSLVGIYDNQAIYWALALGVVFGGLATPIGTAANIVMIGISKTTHFTIHFKEFVKIGLPTSILSLVLSTFYLLIRYG